MEVTETLLLKSSFDTTSERCLLAERETANIWSISNQTQTFMEHLNGLSVKVSILPLNVLVLLVMRGKS